MKAQASRNFYKVKKYRVTGYKCQAPGKVTWKCKYDLVWGRKEALDKLTSTNWPLVVVILSGFSPSLILYSVFWLPTSKSPLWATLIQLYASKARSEGLFKDQYMGVLLDKAWTDNLNRGSVMSYTRRKYSPFLFLVVFTIPMVLVFCFGEHPVD